MNNAVYVIAMFLVFVTIIFDIINKQAEMPAFIHRVPTVE